MGVIFSEHESYFTKPYLQGDSSIMEDKDRRDFLLDLLSLTMSKPPVQVSLPVLESELIPENPQPMFVVPENP